MECQLRIYHVLRLQRPGELVLTKEFHEKHASDLSHGDFHRKMLAALRLLVVLQIMLPLYALTLLSSMT